MVDSLTITSYKLVLLKNAILGVIWSQNSFSFKLIIGDKMTGNLNSNQTCEFEALNQCTMAKALKKFRIKDFAKMMTLAPIFSSQNYFR